MEISPAAIRNIQPHLAVRLDLPSATPFPADPWLRLFSTATVPVITLFHLLSSGHVSPGYRDGSGHTLLQAYLSRWTDAQSNARIKSSRVHGQPFPATPDGTWSPMEAPSEANLAGLLLGHGLDPFAPQDSGYGDKLLPDALDVALGQGWDEVALHCLSSPTCPPVAQLNARQTAYILPGTRHRLPWPHVLAHVGRARVLESWLALPGMDPDFADRQGRSPLFYATTREVLDVLLRAGASPNVLAKDGRTIQETWDCPPRGALMVMPSIVVARELAAALAAAATDPQEGYEKWVTAPPSSLLPSASPQDLAAARITRRIGTGSSSIEWGLAGFLAWSWLGLNSFDRKPDVRKSAPAMVKGLLEKLPRQAWLNESLPGVPDIHLMSLACSTFRYAYPHGLDFEGDLVAALDEIHPCSARSSFLAALAVVPHLRGDPRRLLVDHVIRTVRKLLFTTPAPLPGVLDFLVQARDSRWFQASMEVLGYNLITSSLAPAVLAHPHAREFVLWALANVPPVQTAAEREEGGNGGAALVLDALRALPGEPPIKEVQRLVETLRPEHSAFGEALRSWVASHALSRVLPLASAGLGEQAAPRRGPRL